MSAVLDSGYKRIARRSLKQSTTEAPMFKPDEKRTESAYDRFWRKRGLVAPRWSPNRKRKAV